MFADVLLYHIPSDDGVGGIVGVFGAISFDREMASFGRALVYIVLCVYVVSGDGYQQPDIEREGALGLFPEGGDYKESGGYRHLDPHVTFWSSCLVLGNRALQFL